MESKIKRLIKLANHPVAVMQADVCPEDAIQFKEGKWGCVIAMLSAAAKGKTAAFSDKTTVCIGARAGLGFEKYPLGWIEYFLSTGSENVTQFERYKKTPELAREFVESISNKLVESLPPRKKYLLFKPLDMLAGDEEPLCIVFLVNADQLSALATLANFDSAGNDKVKTLFGAGCAQTVLYPLTDAEHCYVGLTDLSARKCIDKNLLSFSIPYQRFLELEDEAEESFLTAETWEKIAGRIAE